MIWLIPLSLLIVFEFIADIFAKEWSIHHGPLLWIWAIGAYVIANTFWLIAMRNGAELSIGAVIFSLSSEFLAVFLGLIIYKEPITALQRAGVVLGFVSPLLILWK